MSTFDDLLSRYEPPSESDVFLPGRVGSPDKGGAASAASAQTAATSASPASAGPAPEPQLPEGSDPDDPEPEEPEDEQAEVIGEDSNSDEGTGFPDDGLGDAPEPQPHRLPEATVVPVVPRKGGGLSFEGESAYLKQFPRVLIDQMRELLAPQLGDVFARDISQVSIVTAFVAAAMGSELQTDEITAHALRAFRAVNPRADQIDKRTAALLEEQARTQELLKRVLKKLGDVEDTTQVLEVMQSYALAERTAQLDTAGALPETLDVTQKRVIASRDNARRKVAALRRDEKIKAGRPIR